jgi:hypothetical protein
MKTALFLPLLLMGLFSYNQFWLIGEQKKPKQAQKMSIK